MLSLQEQYNRAKSLQTALEGFKELSEKSLFLDSYFKVQSSVINKTLEDCSLKQRYLLKCLLVLGQESIVKSHHENKTLPILLSTLEEIEAFYAVLGGVIGYHKRILELILEEEGLHAQESTKVYKKPFGIDISRLDPQVKKAIRNGIENLAQVSEIYPVGGAGDRLNLCNGDELLPAAQLPFTGMTLLEGLIRDLQSREYLYFKLFGKQVQVPIAMMTSVEKRNHEHIVAILEKNEWFNRPKEKFFLFTQPMVPVISIKGEWILAAPGQLMLKPGGHGVLWKLAQEKGVLDWLYSLGCEKALVRQINNPIAGTDYGLLAFLGIGLKQNKTFGFASCNRYVNVAEGMDILIEQKVSSGYAYCLTNIEYPEFAKKGVQDKPESSESPFSIFPANTNILFAHLKRIEKLLSQDPIPGMLINMKTKVSYTDEQGNVQEVQVGRLESTMQNIADHIVDYFPEPLKVEDDEKMQTFITYNERDKTISVTKKAYIPGQPLQETPEGCFYTIQKNMHALFADCCAMEVPPRVDEATYLEEGPSFVSYVHPGLGPVWSIIAQKIQRGSIAPGSELQLMIAEIEICDLKLDGSLVIESDDPLGHKGTNTYSENGGRCSLKEVQVKNKGINRRGNNVYWKKQLERYESLKIILSGNAEFVAENVIFEGNVLFEVPSGYRLTITQGKNSLNKILEKIEQPSWNWHYSFDQENNILLKKIC